MPNLIHSIDDFSLLESGSWPTTDGDQYLDEEIAEVINEAKRADALAELLSASAKDGKTLINRTSATMDLRKA